MNGIRYLFFTTLKNAIIGFFKSPSKLILGIFMVAMIGVTIVGGNAPLQDGLPMRDSNELGGIAFALYLLVFVLTAYSGFSSGASFYSMPDVNLLFQLPVSSKRILLYGLIKQMGTSLLVGVFILFQYTTLHRFYGVSYLGLLLILAGYCGAMFCGQVTAMAIYSYSSSSEKRKRIIKMLLLGAIVLIVAWVAVPAFLAAKTDPIGAAVAAVSVPWVDYIPVAGWMRGVAAVSWGGGLLPAVIGIALLVGYVVLLIMVITRSRADFYEDVLKATEVMHSAILAKKEGKVEVLPQNVKVGKSGINGGKGSGVFYYKHVVENRRARVFILDGLALIMAITSIGMAFFLKDLGILVVFGFTTYMQVFSMIGGRWLKELALPYVYLIPEDSFWKLWMVCRENIRNIVAEALFIYVPILFIMQLPIQVFLSVLVARVTFGILFMAGNILCERILGGISSRVILQMFYFLVMLTLAIPGIVGGVVVFFFVEGAFVLPLAFGVMVVWNLLVSSVILFACRRILDHAELNGR